jgi:general secretion pathway protein E
MAQRLVRVLCSHCKEPYKPDPTILEALDIPPAQFGAREIYRAKGCPQCFFTGFRGRIGIFEIMVLDDAVKAMILKSFDANLIKQEALKQGMMTLRQDGIHKVLQGITTIEEVLRVTQK